MLIINCKQIQGKQVREKLCSRLESAQKHFCVKHEQVRIHFFSCTLGEVKGRRGKATTTRSENSFDWKLF